MTVHLHLMTYFFLYISPPFYLFPATAITQTLAWEGAYGFHAIIFHIILVTIQI